MTDSQNGKERKTNLQLALLKAELSALKREVIRLKEAKNEQKKE